LGSNQNGGAAFNHDFKRIADAQLNDIQIAAGNTGICITGHVGTCVNTRTITVSGGATGVRGATGTIGAIGRTGITGATGISGPVGFRGSNGGPGGGYDTIQYNWSSDYPNGFGNFDGTTMGMPSGVKLTSPGDGIKVNSTYSSYYNGSVIIGSSNSTYTSTDNVMIGNDNSTDYTPYRGTTIVGHYNRKAYQQSYAVMIGDSNYSESVDGINIGSSCMTLGGYDNIAIGYWLSTDCNGSIAVGSNFSVSGNYSMALGYGYYTSISDANHTLLSTYSGSYPYYKVQMNILSGNVDFTTNVVKAKGANLPYYSIPTSDPHVRGKVWRSGSTLKISAG
jgi:hypothetical protein